MIVMMINNKFNVDVEIIVQKKERGSELFILRDKTSRRLFKGRLSLSGGGNTWTGEEMIYGEAVFIVFRWDGGQWCNVFKGLFSSPEKAQAFIDKEIGDDDTDNWEISIEHVDDEE